jgi:hypothetical protein
MHTIKNLSNEAYHADPAVSKSILDKINKSPLHCRAYLDGLRTEPTAAMQFGTALHTAVLEPHLFAAQYAVFDGDRRTKDGKLHYELLRSTGATIISAADSDAISAMSAAIHAHPMASWLLRDGMAEQSVFWTDPTTGLQCKCRPDWWRTDGIVIDVKTTEDASPAAFARSIATFRYHVQAAHYLAGTQADRFVFVVVEKKAPFAVAVYELDSIALELGEMQRTLDLSAFNECHTSGYWPGYSDVIETIALPGWAFPKTESEEVQVEYV